MAGNPDHDATVYQRGPAAGAGADGGDASTLDGDEPGHELAPLVGGGDNQRYRRGAELGRGGMGRVVEATDTVLGRTVAVKEIADGDAELAHRFEREVYVTARLEHPSIVPVYDAGRTPDGLPFYVMRRVSGRPLDTLIGEADDLDARLALVPNVLAAVDAIAHAHTRSVIHRDLKPGNVLVGDHGETLVIDWGLAKLLDEADETTERDHARIEDPNDLRTQLGTVIGTPGFMPPEQALGTVVDCRGDVYALGATLYHVLAGKPPWSGTRPTEILDKVVTEPPPALATLVSGVPPDLAAIVDKAMARDAGARYADAGALGDDLRRFLRGQLVAAHRYSRGQRLARWLRRNRAAIVVATAAAVALITVATLSLRRIVDDRDRLAASEHRTRSALAQAEDQNDRLLLETARAAVDSDPTYALTRLAELPATSARWPQARSIASAARARGITYAYAAAGAAPWATTMSPDGMRVAVFSNDRVILIHDLVSHTTQQIDGPDDLDAIAWTGPTRLALAANTSIVVRDLAAGGATVETWQSPEHISQLFGASTGSLVWRTDGDRVFSTNRDAVREVVLPPGTTKWIRVSADGNYLVGAGPGGGRALVFDGTTWRALASATGNILSIAFAPDSSRFAMMTETEVREWVIDGAVVTERGPFPGHGNGELEYAGTHLLGQWMLYPTLDDLSGDPAEPIAQQDGFPLTVTGIGDGAVAIAESDHVVLIAQGRSLRIPMREAGMLITARIGTPFVAVAGHAYVTIIDLREVWPDELPITNSAGAAGLVPDSILIDEFSFARVIDVATGAYRDLEGPLMPRIVDEQDWMAYGRLSTGDTTFRILPLDGRPAVDLEGVEARVATVTRKELIAGTDAGDLVAYPLDRGPRHAIAHIGSTVNGVFDRGPWLVAFTADHGLWRRGATGIETASLPALPTLGTVAADGTFYAITDRELYRWPPGGAPAVLAHLGFDAVGIALPGTHQIAVVGADQAVYRVDLADGGVRAILPTSRWSLSIALDGNTAARVDDAGDVRIADLDNADGWTIPAAASAPTSVQLAPDGRVLFAFGGDHGALRYINDLPRDPAALRAWILNRTNARAGAQFGVVEWQLPEPTPVR